MIFIISVGYVLVGAFVACVGDQIFGWRYDFPFELVWVLWPLVIIVAIMAGIAAVPVFAGNKLGEWISTRIKKQN